MIQAEYFMTCAYVSCMGYVGILKRACRCGMNQGGTAGNEYLPVLDREYICQGRFYVEQSGNGTGRDAAEQRF